MRKYYIETNQNTLHEIASVSIYGDSSFRCLLEDSVPYHNSNWFAVLRSWISLDRKYTCSYHLYDTNNDLVARLSDVVLMWEEV